MPKPPAKTQPPATLAEALARIPKGKDYLSTEELCTITGAHKVTVYRWVARGDLTAYGQRRWGRASLYKRDEVERFVRLRFAVTARSSDHDGQAGKSPAPGGKKARRT